MRWLDRRRKRIGRDTADGGFDPFLDRWNLVRFRGYALRLHLFHRSDPTCLHDHPWSFVSLVLAGGYFEITETGRRWRAPLTIAFRPATFRHRVELAEQKAWTLVFTWPQEREWGFHTHSGWKRNDVFDDIHDVC